MPTFRITWYFGHYNTGWSETWHKEATTPTSLKIPVENLTAARLNMLPIDAKCLAVRISDADGQRYSRLFVPGNLNLLERKGLVLELGRDGAYPTESNIVSTDQVRAALQVELVEKNRRIAMRYMAGIPDLLSASEPATVALARVPKWKELFDKWALEVWNKDFGIMVLNKEDKNPLLPVKNWTIINNNVSELAFTVNNHPDFLPKQSDKVAVQLVRMTNTSYKSPNGTWIVSSVTPSQGTGETTVSLRSSEGYDPAYFTLLGKVRLVKHVLMVPDMLLPFRVGIHKRGKPFGLLVGRKKTPRYVG